MKEVLVLYRMQLLTKTLRPISLFQSNKVRSKMFLLNLIIEDLNSYYVNQPTQKRSLTHLKKLRIIETPIRIAAIDQYTKYL